MRILLLLLLVTFAATAQTRALAPRRITSLPGVTSVNPAMPTCG